jgi:transposase-like protein
VNSKQVQRRELWRQRLAEQEKSGRLVSVFCREQSLNEATFYAWRKRLIQETPVSFALVETKASAEPAPPIELLLTGGERLRIPCDASMLKMVLAVLRERR